MATALADQEKLVIEILSLFDEFLDEVYPDPEDRQDLRTTIDLAVHFYFYLKERASGPLDLDSDEIDDVLLDLTANASSFWHARNDRHMFVEREPHLVKWEPEHFKDLESLKSAYFLSYEKLISESTPLKERYLHLLRLTKIQLMFAAIVFA